MATFSKKMMGKEVGNASVYAAPHTMDGKAGVGMKAIQDPDTLSAKQISPRTVSMRVSLGDPAADDVKTSGIKMRGAGCATKGVMSRGPMA
jgi:hypothetical protein